MPKTAKLKMHVDTTNIDYIQSVSQSLSIEYQNKQDIMHKLFK